MELDRREGESYLSYHKRIIYGKLVDKTLSDYDYSELAERIYGKEYASDVARRMMYGSRKTIEIFESDENNRMPDDALAELEEKKIELQKERQKFFDQRAAYNKILRERSRQEELNEILTAAVMEGDLPALEYVGSPEKTYSGNDLLVSLNDIHYGASVNNYWTKYDPDTCKEMMRVYLDEIIRIAKTHASENCYVWSNGDAISGNIHYSLAVTNKENVIEQIMGVSELISEFLAELSKYFCNVIYISVAGNHSRINPDKEQSRTDERLDDLVEWYIKARLQNFENISVGGEKIDETMYLIDIRGKTYLGVHGDYDGSASKVQSLQTMAGRPLYAILSGHMHHNRVDNVQGIKTVMAGSFLGMDDFCVQKRIYGKPEQMVCVCDNSGIRCYYDVDLIF